MGAMTSKLSIRHLNGTSSLIAFALLLLGCEAGGVGDPCIPEDEYTTGFSGFSVEEVNVESRSFQCETRICLVNHFQGRVSCPYGNKESSVNVEGFETPPDCHIPDNPIRVTAPVDPQLAFRQAADSVYCSCRCDGPSKNARYCECPSGFACTNLVDDLSLGSSQLVGSYCVREGTLYEKNVLRTPCRYTAQGMTGGGSSPESQGNCGAVDRETGAPL